MSGMISQMRVIERGAAQPSASPVNAGRNWRKRVDMNRVKVSIRFTDLRSLCVNTQILG